MTDRKAKNTRHHILKKFNILMVSIAQNHQHPELREKKLLIDPSGRISSVEPAARKPITEQLV